MMWETERALLIAPDEALRQGLTGASNLVSFIHLDPAGLPIGQSEPI